MEDRSDSDATRADPGERVFDADGRPLGRVAAVTDDGFEVVRQDATDPEGRDNEELPGEGLGEGYIMWRCTDCGEMGELDEGIPSECPNCGAPEEALSEVKED